MNYSSVRLLVAEVSRLESNLATWKSTFLNGKEVA